MPADYAHLYFGRNAVSLLPESFAQAVAKNRQLFNIGLQGPDILFFYEPLHKCSINRIGYAMHDASAKEFFLQTREILNTRFNEPTEKSSALAYLAGFLCHYTLDMICHSYIEKKIEVSKLSHSTIEKEFDRYLMVKEKGAVAKVKSSIEFEPSDKNATIVSAFFSNISEQQIKKALQSMKFFTNLLSGKGLRRPLVTIGLKISGQYDKLYDMIIPKKSPDKSADSNLRLEKLLDKALSVYGKLAREYEIFLQGGDFPESLSKTFGPDENWRDIPVLTFEEEKLYEV